MTESYVPRSRFSSPRTKVTIKMVGLWELNRLKVTRAVPSEWSLCSVRTEQRACLFSSTRGHSKNMACYKLSQSPHRISKGLDLGLPAPQSCERGPVFCGTQLSQPMLRPLCSNKAIHKSRQQTADNRLDPKCGVGKSYNAKKPRLIGQVTLS